MLLVKTTSNNVSKAVPLVDRKVKVSGSAHVLTEPCTLLIGNALYQVERPIDKHLNLLYFSYQNKLYYYRDTTLGVACQKMELLATGTPGTSWSHYNSSYYLCGADLYCVSNTSARKITGMPSSYQYLYGGFFTSGSDLYFESTFILKGSSESWSYVAGCFVKNGTDLYVLYNNTAVKVTGLPDGWTFIYNNGNFNNLFQSGSNLYYIPAFGAGIGVAEQVSGLSSGWTHVYANIFAVGLTLYDVDGTTVTEIATETSGSWYSVSGKTGAYVACGLKLYELSSVSGCWTASLLGSGNSGTWNEVEQNLLACGGSDLYYTGYGSAAHSLVPIEHMPSEWQYLGDSFFASGTSVYKAGLSATGSGYAWVVSGLPSDWQYLTSNYFYKGSDLYYVAATETAYKAYKVTGLPSGWEYIKDIRFHCGNLLYGIRKDSTSGYKAVLLATANGDTWQKVSSDIYACGTKLYRLRVGPGTIDDDAAVLPFYYYNLT